MTPTANSDEQLVEWSRTGDRDAFARIVQRYQALVCSITYNATGSLTLSEDLAQETFVAAWKQLTELREPSQLRAWLCGIARFRVGKELRRRGHEPSSGAEPLDTLHDSPTPEPSPSAQAVTHEEEAILWRALERIPDTYREPLILFYREQQSVERVAAELELTEDAVKQRLSRGRKLLHEEVIAFVEGTLSRTAPGEAFSGAVLAALPMAAASTAASTAGAAAAKSGAFAWLAPVLGILGGMFAHWLVVQGSPTEAERRAKKISFASLWVFILAWCVGGQIGLRTLSKHFQWTDQTCFTVATGFWFIYAVVGVTMTIGMLRWFLALRRESERRGETSPATAVPFTPQKNFAVTFGTNFAFFSWLAYIPWQLHDRVSVGIIMGVMVVLTTWNFFAMQGKTGVAAMRLVSRHLAIAWAAVLLIVNLGLPSWIAVAGGTTLAEVHRLLPIWVIPVLTLALLLWAGVVILLTRPSRPVR